MDKKNHYVSAICEEKGRFVLFCRTTAENYHQIVHILCEGDDTAICRHEKIETSDGSVQYRVEIPTPLSGRCIFSAIYKNEIRKRVWKPDETLATSGIPETFYFTDIFLNLAYNENKQEIERIISNRKNNPYAYLTSIRTSDNQYQIDGYLFLETGVKLQTGTIDLQLSVMRFGEEGNAISFNCETIDIEQDEKIFNSFTTANYLKFGGRYVKKFSCKLIPSALKSLSGQLNLYLFYQDKHITLKNYFNHFKQKEYHISTKSFFKRYLYVLYCDEAVNIWKLEGYSFRPDEKILLSLLSRKCLRKNNIRKNIWLIGEYPATARDNGLHFFQYLRKNHPSIPAYYVIYRDSKDKKKIADPHILYYGSYKHFKIASQATVLICTHFPSYLVPKLNTITQYKERYKAYRTFFIQHGVIATTASVLIYRKSLRNYERFFVSSSFEKNNICKHLDYNPENVVITGLARWDRLLDLSIRSTDIFIMPTWRNNLTTMSNAEFKDTPYSQFWNKLLQDSRFLELIRKKNIRVYFNLHERLARFSQCLSIPPKVIQIKNQNIQERLATCGLLITDYSSVAFDVLLQNKPVIFCPFDYDEMMDLRKGPRFINYKDDLPGPLCHDVDATIGEIKKCIDNNYQIPAEYHDRRRKFYMYIDRKNCYRIFNEIHSAVNGTPPPSEKKRHTPT